MNTKTLQLIVAIGALTLKNSNILLGARRAADGNLSLEISDAQAEEILSNIALIEKLQLELIPPPAPAPRRLEKVWVGDRRYYRDAEGRYYNDPEGTDPTDDPSGPTPV